VQLQPEGLFDLRLALARAGAVVLALLGRRTGFLAPRLLHGPLDDVALDELDDGARVGMRRQNQLRGRDELFVLDRFPADVLRAAGLDVPVDPRAAMLEHALCLSRAHDGAAGDLRGRELPLALLARLRLVARRIRAHVGVRDVVEELWLIASALRALR